MCCVQRIFYVIFFCPIITFCRILPIDVLGYIVSIAEWDGQIAVFYNLNVSCLHRHVYCIGIVEEFYSFGFVEFFFRAPVSVGFTPNCSL